MVGKGATLSQHLLGHCLYCRCRRSGCVQHYRRTNRHGFQLNLFGVISLAFVTAVGGGIARDILVNDVPMILRTDLYGSVAILIGGLIYLFGRLGWINIFYVKPALCRRIVVSPDRIPVPLATARFPTPQGNKLILQTACDGFFIQAA